MKDYKGALYFLMTETHEYNGGKIIPIAQNAIDDLQELVNRSEPMKVDVHTIKHSDDGSLTHTDYLCSKCKSNVWFCSNYCHNCGQALKWESEKV